MGADRIADLLPQRLVELDAGLGAHEQHHAHVVLPVLPDRQRLDDLGETLDGRIDLRGADAHSARIQHRIGAAVDDQAVMLGHSGVVAVMPHAGEALEVRGPVLAPVGVVPESDRHARERRGAHQLAALAAHRAAGVIEDLHPQAEAAALDLPAMDRPRRAPQGEARNDVGSPGDRGEQQVGLHGAVHVIEAVGQQRRAGR